ncbi:hypothetical protein [Polyangium sp. 6x1]|uniref:hypothetical protein n=1 Tax=Polyangium sp. 6x1 TaxID=3042689 RepID=UPI0024826E00|nr:hypothetical protein [Polyangium sp. 6x1]MDI1445027.1 hypothetical protein [Polyangium sp. 6x1]
MLVCGLVWAGCGSEPDPSSGTTYTLDKYYAALAEVECMKAFDCCEMTELVDALGFDPPPATVEACTEQLSAYFTAQLDPTKAKVAAGRLIYSPDHAEACVAKAKAASCVDFYVNRTPSKDPDCKGAIDPGVALGGACLDQGDCKDEGALCFPAALDESPWTCNMARGDGEPCLFNECAQGLYCKFPTNLCAAPVPTGAACGYPDDCQSGICDNLVCVDPLPIGASCSNGGRCVPEGYCDTTTSMCTAEKPDGAACDSGMECMTHLCSDKICGFPPPICDGL